MKRNDDGVTLIELLVVLSISGMLATAIAAAFAVGVKTTDAANQRLAGSRGAQLTTSYFPSDVRSWNGAATGIACASGTTVVSFGWVERDGTDPTPVATDKRAEYCLDAGNLVRRYWTRVLPAAWTLQNTSTVAYDVSGAGVSCLPVVNCSTPSSATITVTETGGYTFSITGRRRAT